MTLSIGAVAVRDHDRGDDPTVVSQLDFHPIGVGQREERSLLAIDLSPGFAGDAGSGHRAAPGAGTVLRGASGRDRDSDEQATMASEQERRAGAERGEAGGIGSSVPPWIQMSEVREG